MRLARSALEAEKLWIKYWTSTLLTSPHKDIKKIFQIWDEYSLEKKLEFLKIAFRKNNWFLRSVEYCKTHKIYRQNYCRCIYSDTFNKENFTW
jgi:predicted adenine nucleotide alpha hydrolase (AANH) superfamily ATPase